MQLGPATSPARLATPRPCWLRSNFRPPRHRVAQSHGCRQRIPSRRRARWPLLICTGPTDSVLCVHPLARLYRQSMRSIMWGEHRRRQASHCHTVSWGVPINEWAAVCTATCHPAVLRGWQFIVLMYIHVRTSLSHRLALRTEWLLTMCRWVHTASSPSAVPQRRVQAPRARTARICQHQP